MTTDDESKTEPAKPTAQVVSFEEAVELREARDFGRRMNLLREKIKVWRPEWVAGLDEGDVFLGDLAELYGPDETEEEPQIKKLYRAFLRHVLWEAADFDKAFDMVCNADNEIVMLKLAHECGLDARKMADCYRRRFMASTDPQEPSAELVERCAWYVDLCRALLSNPAWRV